MQAGSCFYDRQFRVALNSASVSQEAIDKYTCFALGGICSEFVVRDKVESGKFDLGGLNELYKLMRVRRCSREGDMKGTCWCWSGLGHSLSDPVANVTRWTMQP